MKSKSKPALTGKIQARAKIWEKGTTLVEMMVGMFLFALVSIGITISLVQLRKQGENAMSQTIAQAMAEGILEQIRRAGFPTLSDFSAEATIAPADFPASITTSETALAADGSTYTTYRNVDLKFIAVGSDNYATVQDFNLYWAADNSTYLDVGARASSTDVTSAILGVVLDMDYRDSTTGVVIRPRRFMKMKVNITRTLNTNKDVVEIVLRYKWAIPDRRTSTGDVIYYSAREMRAIISKIPTY